MYLSDYICAFMQLLFVCFLYKDFIAFNRNYSKLNLRIAIKFIIYAIVTKTRRFYRRLKTFMLL